jgi:hypothetical protein
MTLLKEPGLRKPEMVEESASDDLLFDIFFPLCYTLTTIANQTAEVPHRPDARAERGSRCKSGAVPQL